MSARTLLLLFTAFRLAAGVLYRPGGLLGVGGSYPDLPTLELAEPLARQGVWGVLLLVADVRVLLLLRGLVRRGESDEGAMWRAVWWAASPLPLWGWLTGVAPLGTLALLTVGARLGRRTWVGVALALALLSLVMGPRVVLTVPLLALILLTVPDAAAVSALFTVGALVAGPVAELLGVTGGVLAVFRLAYVLALFPALATWLLLLRPAPAWDQWYPRLRAASALGSVGLLTVALFGLAPQVLRPVRFAASPLATTLGAMQAAPGGWFLTDSAALWEQGVGLGVGTLVPRVLSEHNAADLRLRLLAVPTSLWLLQSPSERAPEVVEPLVAGFFPAEEQAVAEGIRLRPFVSTLDAPRVAVNGAFADGVALVGVRLPPSVEAGSLLPVELHWEGGADGHKLFLHLLAPDGTRVSQRDVLPGPTPDRHALLLPSDLAPGPYILMAGRYDGATGERVALLQGGDTSALGTVTVR